MVKYSHTLNECWKKLDGVCKMHHLLAEKRVNPDYPSAPGNLGSLLDAFKNEIIQVKNLFFSCLKRLYRLTISRLMFFLCWWIFKN